MPSTLVCAHALARTVATAPRASGDRASSHSRSARIESRRAVVRGSASQVAMGGNKYLHAKVDTETTSKSSRRDFLTAQVVACALCVEALVPSPDALAALEASALPNDYTQKARAVVKALTESLEFESIGSPSASDRFRNAEPAKEAVKTFIKDGWASDPSLQGERSHDDIVVAIRELSEFYKANGSRMALDKTTRDSVLEKLYDADSVLPKLPPTLAERLLGL